LLAPRATHRALFAASTTPAYERIAAFAAPAIAGVGAAVAIWLLLQRRRCHPSAALGLYGLGLLYFASLPLMLTQGGNEAARRSWSFSYVGLAVLLAPSIPWLLRQTSAPRGASVLPRYAGYAGIATLLAVLLVGNTAATTNELYRFPGAVVYGSDTRTITPELLDTVRWFRDTYGTQQLVIADRGTALAFAGFGDEWTATGWSGLPIWQLYLSSQPPSTALLHTLRNERYGFLIIDRRMVQFLPWIGFYLTAGEPLSHVRSRPPPRESIERYEQLPWAIKIYQTEHLEIYRLDYSALALNWQPARDAGSHAIATSTFGCCGHAVRRGHPGVFGADPVSPPGAH
jgi:hypothetical protein